MCYMTPFLELWQRSCKRKCNFKIYHTQKWRFFKVQGNISLSDDLSEIWIVDMSCSTYVSIQSRKKKFVQIKYHADVWHFSQKHGWFAATVRKMFHPVSLWLRTFKTPKFHKYAQFFVNFHKILVFCLLGKILNIINSDVHLISAFHMHKFLLLVRNIFENRRTYLCECNFQIFSETNKYFDLEKLRSDIFSEISNCILWYRVHFWLNSLP